MQLLRIETIETQMCYDISVKDTNCFFAQGILVHNSNAGVRRHNGKFQPQSRENIISVGNDNYGFAQFISGIPEDDLNTLFDAISTKSEDDITLYGEWCGKGIQDTVAICQLDKQWVLFGARVNGAMVDFYDHKTVCNHKFSIHNIFEIPYYKVEVNFKAPETAMVEFERITLEVEDECPWGKHFGVVGTGEGVVWTCVERPSDTDLYFKTKGTKHSKSKVRKVVTVDIERVNNINALVDVILPNGRLDQGIDILVNQMKLDIDPVNMGTFMKWIANDILKEELDTISGNGFEWTYVVKTVNERSRLFFFSKKKEF